VSSQLYIAVNEPIYLVMDLRDELYGNPPSRHLSFAFSIPNSILFLILNVSHLL